MTIKPEAASSEKWSGYIYLLADFIACNNFKVTFRSSSTEGSLSTQSGVAHTANKETTPCLQKVKKQLMKNCKTDC